MPRMPLSENKRREIVAQMSGHVTDQHLNQAKLILRACGVPHGDIETVKSVSNLYTVISKNLRIFPGYDAITVLQCILREVQVPVDKVKKLGCDEHTLDGCREEMKLATLVVGLRRGLTNDQFDELKELARERIDTDPDNIPTREKFFHICLDQRVFEEEETLVEFKGWLGALKRDDLAKTLEDYIKEWKKGKLAALLLCLRDGLTDAQHDEFKYLAQECFSSQRENILRITCEEFFQICLDQRVFIKKGTLARFKRWLATLPRTDLAKSLEDYIEERKPKRLIQEACCRDPDSKQFTLIIIGEDLPESIGQMDSGVTLAKINGNKAKKILDDAFAYLGSARLILRNPNVELLVAVIAELPNYLHGHGKDRVMTYFMGHGANGRFHLQNGSIDISNEVIAEFSTQDTEYPMQRLHFFDCCRVGEEFSFPTICLKGDTAVMFSTQPSLIAYTGTEQDTDDGVGVFTRHFAMLVKTHEGDFEQFARELGCRTKKELERLDPELNTDYCRPILHSTNEKKINFKEERENALRPQDLHVELSEGGYLAIIKVQQPPPLVEHHKYSVQTHRLQMSLQGCDEWTNVGEEFKVPYTPGHVQICVYQVPILTKMFGNNVEFRILAKTGEEIYYSDSTSLLLLSLGPDTIGKEETADDRIPGDLKDNGDHACADNNALFEEAMQTGYVPCHLLLIGVAGSGTRCFSQLVLGGTPPAVRETCNPLAQAAIRVVSTSRATVSGTVWRNVSPTEMGKAICHFQMPLPTPPPPSLCSMANVSPRPEDSNSDSEIQIGCDNASTENLLTNKSMPSEKLVAKSPFVQSMMTYMSQTNPTSASREVFSENWVYLTDSGNQPHFPELLPTLLHHVSAAVIFVNLNEDLSSYPTIGYYEGGELHGSTHTYSFTHEQTIKNCLQMMQARLNISGDNNCPTMYFIGTIKEAVSKESIESKDDQLYEMVKSLKGLKEHVVFNRIAKPKRLMYVVNVKNPDAEDYQTCAEFRQAVMKGCKKMEQKIPLSWFMLEQQLQELAQNKSHVLSLEECLEVAHNLEMDKPRLLAALDHLMHFNHFLFFPQVLPNVVFISWQVLLDKINELVAYSRYLRGVPCADEPSSAHSLNDINTLRFRDYGIVNPTFLKRFDAHYRYTDNLFTPRELLHVLSNHLVFALFAKEDYCMPCVFPVLSLDKVSFYRVPSTAPVPPMLIYFDGEFFPSVLFNALLATLFQDRSSWKIAEKKNEPICLFKNCVMLGHTNFPITLILIYSFEFIEIHIQAKQGFCTESCTCVRQTLFRGLDRATQIQGCNHLIPKVGFFCPCDTEESPHLATISDDGRWWWCSNDDTYSGLLSEEHNIWLSDHCRVQGSASASFNIQQDTPEKADGLIQTIVNKQQFGILCPPTGLGDITEQTILNSMKKEQRVSSKRGSSTICQVLPNEKPTVIRHFEPATESDSDTSATGYWELNKIHDELKLNGEGVVIAIIDNSVNSEHKAFKAALSAGRLKGSCFARKKKGHWNLPGGNKPSHGTMVAFVAGGEAFGKVNSGVAPKSTLLFCSVGNTYEEEAIINALKKLVELKEKSHQNAPDIVLMSFGLTYNADDKNQKEMKRLLKRLRELEVVNIAAAGNFGKSEGGVQFPACISDVIGVGTHGKTGYKQNINAPEGIDVFAPGEQIVHPAAFGSQATECSSGSSCSAPAIAGLTALVLQFSEEYVTSDDKRKKYRDLDFLRKILFGEKLRKGGDNVLLKPRNFFKRKIYKFKWQVYRDSEQQLPKVKQRATKVCEETTSTASGDTRLSSCGDNQTATKIFMEDKPTIEQLQVLTGRSGKRVQVIDSVASEWEHLALALKFETTDIEFVKSNYVQDVRGACTEILTKWLNGESNCESPITWSTLIQSLQIASVQVDIAEDLAEILH